MQNDLLNGRTPEKIKFNVRECAFGHCLSECPYDGSDECIEDLLADAYALIERLESERDAALKAIPRTCATCEHAFYRTISTGEGCKTISVFCKEKECRNADKWQMCEAQTNERKEEGD